MSFKENYLFLKYRDKSMTNAETFRGLISRKHKGVDANKLYTNIVNYQIKKYGRTLNRKNLLHFRANI